MIYPVPIYQGRRPKVSSSFRSSDRPTHQGADIMYKRLPSDGGPAAGSRMPDMSPGHYMPNGLPALAFADGKVEISKEIGTGGYIVLSHAGGLQTQYMHLLKRKVKVGDSVKAGQPIATVSFNPIISYKLNHLHFQIRKNGSLVDPAPYLAAAKMINAPTTGFFLMVASVGVGLILYLRGRRG